MLFCFLLRYVMSPMPQIAPGHPRCKQANHLNATERHKIPSHEAFILRSPQIYDNNTETTAIPATHHTPPPTLTPALSAIPQHVALYVTLFHFAATSKTLPFPTL
ncbi:hypothetical protein VC83_04004 [Pseudogymnoascus destructans]|uniref:Uncharacterized protein n=1 Tax=Pseudogymnoascus destructans TaxID=655981 RepID=A0A177AF36_9PEZI|nr:uncharacterized protein VC83_04004 [Pseudogymnoascus destructans]OAF59774.1 hypothetical protein VC83_04004 [Pseudogymnoascus destructans]